MGQPIAIGQFTIVDYNDITIQSTPPTNPTTNMLWLDISVTPNQLKKWDGTAWQIVSDSSSKKRTFTSQPVPPYDVGDLWISTTTTGDNMVCTTAKAAGSAYAASDWVKDSVTQRMSSAEASIKINADNIALKVSKEYVASRGENLVTNGTGLLVDNTNFSTFTFDKSDAYGAAGSFKDSGYNTTRYSDEFIPVNPNLLYKLNLYAKTNPSISGAHCYTGIACYDVDKLQIDNFMCQGRANTLTTLAQDLKAGDTVVYLTSVSGWVDGSQTYERGFIFWNYANSGGYKYGTSYSRNYFLDMFNAGVINTTNNTITLKTAWNGSTIPAGTQLSQTYPVGGTFTYIGAVNASIPNTWTNYNGTIGPTSSNTFKSSTAYVKLIFLNNRDVTGQTVWYSNISFGIDKVVSNTLISSINLSPESIKISSDKIDIQGILTVSNGSIASGNIATGKTYSGNNDNTNFVDGAKIVGSSYTTFGTGNQSNNNTESGYIQIDLGSVYRIAESRAFFYSGDSRYYYYKIKYSTDGTNWYYAVGNSSNAGWVTSVPSTNGTPSYNATIDRFAVPISARYIRIYGNGNTLNTGNHLYEWELYCTSQTIIDGGQIITGYIKADRIQGGTLVLGGSGNGNGSITIKKSDGTEIGWINNSGMSLVQGNFSVNNDWTDSYGTAGNSRIKASNDKLTIDYYSPGNAGNNGVSVNKSGYLASDEVYISYSNSQSSNSSSYFRVQAVSGGVNIGSNGSLNVMCGIYLGGDIWANGGYLMNRYNSLPSGDGSLGYWHSIPDGTYFAVPGTVTGQPSDWGFIHKIGYGGDFTILWHAQSSGPIWRLSGNGSAITGWSRILFDNDSYCTIANVYTSRIQGSVNSNDYFYMGTGNCRIDCTGGTARFQSNASNYTSIDSGSFSVYLGGVSKLTVPSSGGKTGGTMDIDGVTYGMAPVDCPQQVIENFIWHVQVDEAGTYIELDSIYKRMIADYDVWPSKPVDISDMTPDGFVVSGYTGTITFRIVGKRKDMLDYYYPIMSSIV